jgi:hypothetical protein
MIDGGRRRRSHSKADGCTTAAGGCGNNSTHWRIFSFVNSKSRDFADVFSPFLSKHAKRNDNTAVTFQMLPASGIRDNKARMHMTHPSRTKSDPDQTAVRARTGGGRRLCRIGRAGMHVTLGQTV